MPDGSPVYFDQLIGTPIFSLPLLGYVSVFMATTSGFWMTVTAVLVIISLTFLPGLLKKAMRTENNSSRITCRNKDGAAPHGRKTPRADYRFE